MWTLTSRRSRLSGVLSPRWLALPVAAFVAGVIVSIMYPRAWWRGGGDAALLARVEPEAHGALERLAARGCEARLARGQAAAWSTARDQTRRARERAGLDPARALQVELDRLHVAGRGSACPRSWLEIAVDAHTLEDGVERVRALVDGYPGRPDLRGAAVASLDELLVAAVDARATMMHERDLALAALAPALRAPVVGEEAALGASEILGRYQVLLAACPAGVGLRGCVRGLERVGAGVEVHLLRRRTDAGEAVRELREELARAER